ncbi:cytochrome P450 [Kitasatospora sp. NPDC006697]|uniref:cytochrome P450 n=1 Tax=Kitasatospora sp. NPDC006697 TaxID=3364020 RepID=UPI00368D93D5
MDGRARTTVPLAPGALPGLGHTLPMLRDPLGFLRGLDRAAPLVRLRLGPLPVLLVRDPELVRRLLLDDRAFDKTGPIAERSKDLIGDGLAGCPHARHRRQRRLCQPSFHPHRLPDYAPHFGEAAQRTVGSWRDGQLLRVPEELLTMTMRSTVTAVFAARLPEATGRQLLADLATLLDGSFRQVLTPPPFDRLPIPANRRYREATERFGRTLGALVDDRRRHAAGPGGTDLLSALLGAVDPESPTGARALGDTEVTDQLRTFFVAGTETTAAALGWALHLLARHPGIQRRVRAEVAEVLGGAPPALADLPALPLVRQTVTEALRLYPPAWMLTREAGAGAELGGHRVPAGYTVAWSPYLLHHRADLFPDPERFDPDRWQHTKPDRTSYLPFGSGPRKCIGEQFALTQAALSLATVLGRWRLSPDGRSPVRAAARSTLTPRGLRLRVHSAG